MAGGLKMGLYQVTVGLVIEQKPGSTTTFKRSTYFIQSRFEQDARDKAVELWIKENAKPITDAIEITVIEA